MSTTVARERAFAPVHAMVAITLSLRYALVACSAGAMALQTVVGRRVSSFAVPAFAASAVALVTVVARLRTA